VYIDTVGDPDTYKSRLVRALGDDFATFTIEKKADATYKVVSAASIIAKVSRDHLLKDWIWHETSISELDKNFGSGYPGDDTCVQWMLRAQQNVFGFPNLVRFSWSTTREAMIKNGSCNIKFECDDDGDSSGMENISTIFSAVGQKKAKLKRSHYFIHKKMKLLIPEDMR
jgi:ribonuclease H2 subunit A